MKRSSVSIARAAALAFVLSCGGGPPAATGGAAGARANATPEPPDGPLPKLRTGKLEPTEITTPLSAHVLRASVDAGMETLEVATEWPSRAGARSRMHARISRSTTKAKTTRASRCRAFTRT